MSYVIRVTYPDGSIQYVFQLGDHPITCAHSGIALQFTDTQVHTTIKSLRNRFSGEKTRLEAAMV